MSACVGMAKIGVIGAAVIAAGVLLSPVITPIAMAVGVVAAPIFATKALCHKISWNASKTSHPLADQATIDKNQLKALKQEKKMIQSLDKAKSFAICIIPFGFLSQLMPSRISPRVTELTEQIAQLKPRGNS